jgi:exosome complex exonuclease DIS3/RRP44
MQYLIIDTNVFLHQMDLLETSLSHPNRFLFLNLIILQTVLDEIRSNNIKLYTRVRSFIASHPSAYVFSNEHHRSTYVERLPTESPNDRNDRAIRVAANWYQNHLKGSNNNKEIEVVMLSNDEGNRAKAGMVGAEKIKALSVQQYSKKGKKRPIIELYLTHRIKIVSINCTHLFLFFIILLFVS